MPSRIFFGYRAPPSGSITTLTLTNDFATFTFRVGDTKGISLTQFSAADGSHTFVNAETALWRATAYDTTTAPLTAVVAVVPDLASLTAPTIATDGQGQYITCTWSSLAVGGDALNVVVTLRLNDTEDFLRARITASWATATAYALDTLSVLGLSVEPHQQGDDYAVVPTVFGVLSQDPVENLRFANGVPGFPATGFGQLATNTWKYPTGRGFNVGLWGYYETISNNGWMLYVEDHSLETLLVTFEGDGSNLNWSFTQPQPDNVLIGNGVQSLGSGYTFCLRPLVIAQSYGWWDMGKHYKERIDSQRPVFWTPPRNQRTDYSTKEKSNLLFCEIQAINTGYTAGDGSPGDLATFLESARTNAGVPTTTPIAGIVEAPTYNLQNVGDTAISELNGKLATMYAQGDKFFSTWFPGPIRPDIWDIHRWHQNPGDQAELRWWTSNDEVGVLRMSRKGYIQGGGVDRLDEQTTPSRYYRERNFAVSAWTGPTLIATVAGTPNTAGFTASTRAILIPTSGAARLAQADVTALGATTVRMATSFFNSLGATAIPVAGDAIELVSVVAPTGDVAIGTPVDRCFHAAVNASSYFTRLKNNSAAGQQANFGGCGIYFDVFTDPLIGQTDYHSQCYRDHSAWSKINAGYTRHPYGGGAWHKSALRDYLYQIKQSARDNQIALGREPFVWLSCEDIDETMHDRFDWCWHTVGAGYLWRQTSGTDPAIHKYKTIPLYSVIYPGRTMGRGLNNEFSTGMLDSSLAFTALHEFLAYCLGYEWPYGLTWPTLGLFKNNNIPIRDFWDAAQYQSGGGTVFEHIKYIRNYWSQINYAEVTWITSYLRYGEFLPPVGLDYSLTDTTTGMAQSFWALILPNYQSYDTIYDRAATPKVSHAVWKADDGSVAVILSNWTATTARWAGTIDLTHAGFTADSRVRYRVVDHTMATVEASQTNVGPIFTVGVNEVPAFSIRAIILDEEPTLTANWRAVMVKHRW